MLTANQIASIPGQTAQSCFAAAKPGLTGFTPSNGFGDEAFTAGSAGSVIEVRKGSSIVTVTGGVGGVSSHAVAATRAIAAIVLTYI